MNAHTQASPHRRLGNPNDKLRLAEGSKSRMWLNLQVDASLKNYCSQTDNTARSLVLYKFVGFVEL
jgi:hypothetical protein